MDLIWKEVKIKNKSLHAQHILFAKYIHRFLIEFGALAFPQETLESGLNSYINGCSLNDEAMCSSPNGL